MSPQGQAAGDEHTDDAPEKQDVASGSGLPEPYRPADHGVTEQEEEQQVGEPGRTGKVRKDDRGQQSDGRDEQRVQSQSVAHPADDVEGHDEPQEPQEGRGDDRDLQQCLQCDAGGRCERDDGPHQVGPADVAQLAQGEALPWFGQGTLQEQSRQIHE